MMQPKRGEIWLANLNPVQGSEQGGTRPVLVFQNDRISRYSTTVLAIPLTTNLRRASLPSCVTISQGDGGLTQESVALCHQFKVLDKTRLLRKLGTLETQTIADIEDCMLWTMDI